MLACVACSKHVQGSVEAMDDEEIPKSPATKETIRSITNQLKGMAVRFSAGAYRHCRPCASPEIHEEGSCIDSMDITDASSEVSTSNIAQQQQQHGAGSACFSTPPQSFHSTPGGKQNELAQEMRRNGYGRKGGRVAATTRGWDENGMRGDDQNGGISGYEGAREEEEEMEKNWVAQVEPGVLITLVTLPEGGNDLKRIRFSREMFNKWKAQQWWAENCDKVHELYNVPRCNRLAGSSLPASARSEEELNTTPAPSCHYNTPHGRIYLPPLASASRPPSSHKSSIHPSTTRSTSCHVPSSISDLDAAQRPDRSGDLVSTSTVSAQEVEWVEEDDPGVYITLRSSSPGAATRELKRVRFSREKFTEIQARLWWEENRIRIHEQYL